MQRTPPIGTLNKAGRFAHIDALRAVAVMLVVVAHAGLGDVVPGGSGVTIFFGISGFIISLLLFKERDRTGGFNARSFYARRALKIFPPLILAVVFPSLIYALAGNRVSVEGLLSQVFFTFNWVYMESSREIAVLPGSDVVWSLAIEEQFYIVFAVFWVLAIRTRRWALYTAILGVVGALFPLFLRVWIACTTADADRIYYGTDTRLDAIAMGVLMALVVHRWSSQGMSTDSRSYKVLSSAWIPVLAVTLYAVSLLWRDELFRDTLRFSLQGLTAVLLVGFGMMPSQHWISRLLRKISVNRAISTIGLASYSIYLVHLTVILAIQSAVMELPVSIRIALNVFCGTFAGLLLYFLVERPIQNSRKRRRNEAAATIAPRTLETRKRRD